MAKSNTKAVAWIGAGGIMVAAIIQGVFQFFGQSPATAQNATVGSSGEVVQQEMSSSSQSLQIGRDLNVTNNFTNVLPEGNNPPAVARFPFDYQLNQAKQRIKYLADEYLQVNRMSLVEVTGHYGDNLLESPNLYDWSRVMEELEKQGYLKVLKRTAKNIEFQVTGQLKDWAAVSSSQVEKLHTDTIIQDSSGPNSPNILNNGGNVTINHTNAGRAVDETESRLQSEIMKLLSFPDAAPNVWKPRTLIEKIDSNKVPGRLFQLLMTSSEKEVLKVPKIGNALQSYMKNYYSFQSKASKWEGSVIEQIGPIVVQDRHARVPYVKYVIRRFSGESKEAIIKAAGVNSLEYTNYDITWEDQERVFTWLLNEPSVRHGISEVFALRKSLIDDMNRITSNI